MQKRKEEEKERDHSEGGKRGGGETDKREDTLPIDERERVFGVAEVVFNDFVCEDDLHQVVGRCEASLVLIFLLVLLSRAIAIAVGGKEERMRMD